MRAAVVGMGFVCIAEWTARPGCADDVREILEQLATESRKEPGTVAFEIAPDPDDAEHFVLVETYRDEAAFDAHNASPHFTLAQRLAVPVRLSRTRRTWATLPS
jgi:quinol monooxygenase YgiN